MTTVRAKTKAKPRLKVAATGSVEPPSGEPPGQSLRDIAYQQIKLRIITCAFRPGEYLNEASVSAGSASAAHRCIRRSTG